MKSDWLLSQSIIAAEGQVESEKVIEDCGKSSERNVERKQKEKTSRLDGADRRMPSSHIMSTTTR